MKKLLALIVTVLVLLSCSKDEQITKNLWKNGGDWDIVSMDIKLQSTAEPDDGYTLPNPGSIHFDKDGNCTITMGFIGQSSTEKFTYTNTENTLTLVDEDGEEVVFDLDWKKNDFTMTNILVETEEEDGELVTTTTTTKINCKKRK